jgi:hypothetical protein
VDDGVTSLVADVALAFVNGCVQAAVMSHSFEGINPPLAREPRKRHGLQPVAEQRFSEHLLSALGAIGQVVLASGAFLSLQGIMHFFAFTGCEKRSSALPARDFPCVALNGHLALE